MSSRVAKKPDSIETLRARIDRINLDIVKLANERAELAIRIGRLKRPGAAAVYHPARERDVIERVLAENRGPLTDEHLTRIFGEIISACRSLEHMPRVAFLGPEHTYSHQAAVSRFGSSVEFAPQASIAGVFEATDDGAADFGVVPIENSTEGSVTLTLDMLIDTSLVIIGEILLPVRHALLAREADRSLIKRIVAHQQSLGQCRTYLAKNFPGCELEAVASNALAAKFAAADPSKAAIASSSAAEPYGLSILAENIQDVARNTTRFLVVGKRAVERSGHDKTTVLFAVPDKVGALNQALGLFARNRINISKIESRPLRGRAWEYLFFVDFDGHQNDERVKRTLSSLRRRTLFLKVLGSYPEARSAAA